MSFLSLFTKPVNVAPAPVGSTRTMGTLFGGMSGKASTEAQLDAPSNASTLFAVLDQLKTAVGQTAWGLFDKSDSNPFTQEPQSQRKIRPEHPASKLWAKPNPDQTGMEFRAELQQHFDITGEMCVLVGRNPLSDLPVELWPVRPDRIQPVQGEYTRIIGYIYTTPDGDKIPLTKQELLRVINPHPKDSIRGLGAVQTIMAEVDSATFSAEWNRAFFRNSAQPGGIIEVSSILSETQFNDLRTRWAQQHGGAQNAGRVAILENAKWQQNQFTMVDMQFIEMRKLNSDFIKQALAFPKAQLGEADDVNRANAEAQLYLFARNLVRPRLVRFRELANGLLLPLFGGLGRNVEFEFVDPVTEDKVTEAEASKLRAETVAAYVEAGYDPADALAVAGVPPMGYIGRPARVGGESVIMRGDGTTTVITKDGEIKSVPASA